MATRQTTTTRMKPRPVSAAAIDPEAIRLKAICETLASVASNGGADCIADSDHARAIAEELGVPYLLVNLSNGESNLLTLADLDEWNGWRAKNRAGVSTLKAAITDEDE